MYFKENFVFRMISWLCTGQKNIHRGCQHYCRVQKRKLRVICYSQLERSLMLSCTWWFDALRMINACLKDTAKVSRSDYDLPFFSAIHKQNINNSPSAFLHLENILILSATIKTRSPTTGSGKIARKKIQKGRKCFRILFISYYSNGWSAVTITFSLHRFSLPHIYMSPNAFR